MDRREFAKQSGAAMLGCTFVPGISLWSPIENSRGRIGEENPLMTQRDPG
jgi:hypothetical protein